jgi:hypothetical protein
VVVCLLVPGASWLDGSGWLAWTMFSKSATYRLAVVAENEAGERRHVNPTALAADTRGALRTLLAGAEAWRHAPFGPALRARLPELATLACRVSKASMVRLTLEERATLDAPVRRSELTHACAR